MPDIAKQSIWAAPIVAVLLLVGCNRTPLVNAGGGNVTVITALANSSISLPCDISLPNAHERVTLILWYREDLGIPIYSLEVGDGELVTSAASSVIWSDEKWLGSRAHFRPESYPAVLRVHGLRGSDAGQYRCRVDFTEAPTRNTLVNLTVIVPPDPVVIFDETGARRTSFVGPYREGDTLSLVCDAFGGIPPPRLTWSRAGRLIDETFHTLSNGTVRNEITFHHVDRSFLHAEFMCTATNTNLTRPTTSIVHVDMNFAPVSVTVVNKVDQLVVGRASEIVCRSTGSRPPAHITWYLGGQRIEGGTESASSDGNTTVSILTLRPKMEHIGKNLVCKATNPLIEASDLFDNMDLRIDYAPRVELALGKSIVPSSIFEGGDVYFDCLVDASPKPYRIFWFQNDIALGHNTSEGVILTNRSLVLQRIDRRRSGEYTCQAVNAVGQGRSQAIQLDVKYVPVCKNKDPVVHGVGKGEMVDVLCDVVANPRNVKFRWTFNNSADFIQVPSARAVTVNGTRSKLTYTPRNNKDYGTLMCTAANEVGVQKDPCIFHIILAVAPDPVENCSVINRSAETVHFACLPGFDGGMEQLFEVVVRETSSSGVIYNATVDKPSLYIEKLKEGSSYIATITPRNKKGVGTSRTLEVDTLRHPAVELTQVEDAASASATDGGSGGGLVGGWLQNDWTVMVTGILAGGVASFAVLAVVALVARRCVRRPQNRRTNNGHGIETTVTSTNGNNVRAQAAVRAEVDRTTGTANGSVVATAVLQQQQIHSNNATVRKGILKRTAAQESTPGWDYEMSPGPRAQQQQQLVAPDSPDLVPPPPPMPVALPPTSNKVAISDDCELCLTGSSSTPPPPPPPDLTSGYITREGSTATLPMAPKIRLQQQQVAFIGSRTLPRRTSREGLLNEDPDGDLDDSSSSSLQQRCGEGSSDPLLQIPHELSAVLTLKRGVHLGKQKQQANKESSNNGGPTHRTPLLKRKRESIV